MITLSQALAVAADLVESGAPVEIDAETAARLAPIVAALLPKLPVAGPWIHDGHVYRRLDWSGQPVCRVSFLPHTDQWSGEILGMPSGRTITSLSANPEQAMARADECARAYGWALAPDADPDRPESAC